MSQFLAAMSSPAEAGTAARGGAGQTPIDLLERLAAGSPDDGDALEALFASLLAGATGAGNEGLPGGGPKAAEHAALPDGGHPLPPELQARADELAGLEALIAHALPADDVIASPAHAGSAASSHPLPGPAAASLAEALVKGSRGEGQAEPSQVLARDLPQRAEALRAEGAAPLAESMNARPDATVPGLPAAGQAYAALAAALAARAVPDGGTRAEALQGWLQRFDAASDAAAQASPAASPMQQAPAAAGAERASPMWSLHAPLHQSAQWGEELGDRIRWMVSQQVQSAELKITPPNLGTLEVRISVQKDHMHIAFSTPHAQVREALEDALPRLRELMSGSGFDTVDVDVSEHSSTQQREADTGHSGPVARAGEDEDMLASGETSVPRNAALGIIDFYA